MRYIRRSGISSLLWMILISSAGAQNPKKTESTDSGEKVYDRTLHSTVWVLIPVSGTRARSGSGSLIDVNRRLVLTNYHVVGDDDTGFVSFPIFQGGKLVAERDAYRAPGKRIPGIPQHQFKAGIDHAVTPRWHIGADVVIASSQFLRGDESNSNKPLPGYWRVDLNSRYRVTENIEGFLLIQNLFDRKYSTFGTFFERDQVRFLGLTNPRSVSPAAPLAVLAGVRAVF